MSKPFFVKMEFRMKEKILKIAGKKYFVYVLLAVMIILQLANITNIIVGKKRGYHSDEIFSYGLANSFYEPYLDADGVHSLAGEGHEHNFNNWISGDVIRNYVTVQKGEQFRYDSVWYNQSMDRHPPLYYAIMHTICSFFPDTFSFVFGYIINFVCFAVTQIFLYKLSRNILKSKYLALIACIFWGFSSAAADITIFIRMYCMLAMWGVVFLYLHSKLLAEDGKPFWKKLIPVIIVTLCGALTQYLFLFLAFITAVAFCIRYLCKKQFKAFFAYGFSLLGAVLAAQLIYPAYLPNMFAETSHVRTPFLKQFRLCIRYLLDALFPVTKSGLIFWIPTLSSIAVVLVLMAVPVMYLFRDRDFVKNFLKKLKSVPEKIKSFNYKAVPVRIWGRIKNINFISWVILLSIFIVISVTSYTVLFMEMFYVDRYLFILYPITALLIVGILYFVFSWSKYKKQICAVLLVLMTFARFSMFALHYTFPGTQRIKNISELTQNAECIFTASSYAEIWMMNCLPAEIYDVDKLFVTYLGGQDEYKEQLESIKTDKPIYLLLNVPIYSYFDDEIPGEAFYYIQHYDTNTKEVENEKVYVRDFKKKYEDFYKGLSITENFEYIGEHEIYSRNYYFYRLA